MDWPINQPIDLRMDGRNDQPTNQPINRLMDGPNDQPCNQPTNRPMDGPNDQPCNQPTNQSTDGWTDGLTNQPIDRWTDRPTMQLTNSIGYSPSWEAIRSSASREIPYILRNLMVHYCTHKCLPLVRVPSEGSVQVQGLVKCFIAVLCSLSYSVVDYADH